MKDEMVLVMNAPSQDFTTQKLKQLSENPDWSGLFFMPRDKAETDPTYRQVIPYSVIQRAGDTGVPEYLTYRRDGTEGRLDGLFSIGVGGHVNPIDGFGWKAIINALNRELYEELRITPKDYAILPKMIMLNGNTVDSVHAGIVILIQTWTGNLTRTDEIGHWWWRTVAGLRLHAKNNQLETWSVAALEMIEV